MARGEAETETETETNAAAVRAHCRFIDKYGTHVIVGVKMGGKDVVCVKQLKGSDLTQSDVQARLKKLADDRLSSSSQEDSTAGSGSAAGDGRLSQGLNVSTSLLSSSSSSSSLPNTYMYISSHLV